MEGEEEEIILEEEDPNGFLREDNVPDVSGSIPLEGLDETPDLDGFFPQHGSERHYAMICAFEAKQDSYNWEACHNYDGKCEVYPECDNPGKFLPKSPDRVKPSRIARHGREEV